MFIHFLHKPLSLNRDGVITIICSYRIVIYVILVGGLEHEFYDFPYIGNAIIPTDELHHFSEG